MDEDFPDTLPPDAFGAQEAPDATGPSAGQGTADFPDTLPTSAFSKASNPDDFPETINPADFDASPHTSGKVGAFARGAVEGTAPAIGGLAAGLGTGMALAPVMGPWAIIPGFAAGMGAGAGIDKLQDWALEKMGLRNNGGMFSREQVESDRAQHQYLRGGGEMAPAAIGLNIAGTAAQRAAGAAIGGVASGVMDWLHTGEVDLGNVAMGAGFGAAMPSTNRLGAAVERAGTRVGQKLAGYRGGNGTPPPAEPPRAPPTDPADIGAGVQPPPPEAAVHGPSDIEPVIDPGNKDLAFATAERDKHPATDPMWRVWNEHVEGLKSTIADPADPAQASQGIDAKTEPFSPKDSKSAQQTVSTGTAMEHAPAPQVTAAGNPTGAPMSARTASRPNEPARNYGKTSVEVNGVERPDLHPSVKVSEAPIHEDIAAAMRHEEPARAPEPEQRTVAEAAPVSQPEVPAVQRAPRILPDMTQAPPARAPATIAPADHTMLQNTIAELQKAGMGRVVGELKAMEPHMAVQAAKRLLDAIKSDGKPADSRPTVKGGVQARSNVDRARKEGALNAIDSAVEKYAGSLDTETIPTSLADRKAVQDHLKAMFDHAVELHGSDPLAAYKPRVKPPSWQLLNMAKKVAENPTPARIRDYFQAEKLLREGGADAAKDVQQSNRIDSDIAKKAQIEETAGEAMIENARAEESKGREDHDPYVPRKGQDDHPDTVKGHNRLRDWLNGLSDETYSRLADTHDIATDVRTTRDPQAVMQEYLSDLTKNNARRPPRMDDPAETGPVIKKAAIRNAKDLDRFAPTEEGKAASAGKSLDKNSPEFKRIAAEALAKKPSTIDKLTAEQEAQLSREPTMASDDRPVIDGSEKSAMAHFMDMMSDEGGSAKTDQLLDWMKTKVTDAFSPAALDPIKEYGTSLGGAFNLLSNRLTQFKAQIKANALAANIDGRRLNNDEKSRMYRAMETGEIGLLPAKEKAYYDTYVKPLKQQYERKYDTYRQRGIDEGLRTAEELPERKSNGNGFREWAPRLKKGQAWEGGGLGEENDPLATLRGQTLSDKADTLRDRTFFTLQNTQGERMMYIPGEGKITVMRNGHPTTITTTAHFDPSEIGATIGLKVKGKSDVWTVDHAGIDEIMAGVGKVGGKPRVEFHDDPVVTYTNALYGLNNALEKQNLYISVKNDPIFKENSTLSHSFAKEKGWVQPDLPQFAKHYMPEQMAWAMDDYFKRGFYADGKLGAFKDGLDRAASTFAKIFYFFGPAVHVMNEMDKWIVGRGFRWVTPQGWQSLVVNGAKALKSVHTQDAIQREMTNAGANPMLAHTVTRNIMDKVAKATVMDMQKNHSKWDPFAQAFNVSTKDIMETLYEKSTASMWYGSDILLTQRYLEEKQMRGLSPEAAVKSAHDFVDSYRMPTTVGSKVLGEGGGRMVQKALTDPTISLFGPYHYGVFHSIAHVLKDLAGPRASLTDRARAAGQLAVQLGLLYAVYPVLTSAYRAVTGVENAEVEPRGMSRLLNTGKEFAHGQKGMADITRNIWTPSVPMGTMMAHSTGKDFRGKDILDPQPLDLPGIRDMSTQYIDFLARQLVSPYNTLSQAGLKPDATAGSVTRKFAEGMFGIREPSDAEQRRRDTIDTVQMRSKRAREKRPAGGLEWLNNQLK